MTERDTVWICYEPSRVNDATALASSLRRQGVPVDMPYGGRLRKQTKTARSSDPLGLVTLFDDGRSTLRRRWDESGRELATDDIDLYLAWQAEDDDPPRDPMQILTLLGDDPVAF